MNDTATSSEFLGDDDLRKLTGLERKSAQMRWLRKHGIMFWPNAKGQPVVPVSAIHGKPEARWEPKVSPG